MDAVMELSSKDYQTLLNLICRLHNAKDSKALFLEIWDSLRDELDLTTGVFIPADRESGDFLLEA